MSAKYREFIYTKDNGGVSKRNCIMLRPPQKHWLALDVTDLPPDEVQRVLNAITEWENKRDNIFESLGLSNCWRSFKDAGIEWTDEE